MLVMIQYLMYDIYLESRKCVCLIVDTLTDQKEHNFVCEYIFVMFVRIQERY